MTSEYDESSLSDKSFNNDSESMIDSEESDYDPDGGADIKNVHQVITDDRRKQLVSLINDHGLTIAKASRKVGLMYSTAKTIYAKYRRENPNMGKECADESNEGKTKQKTARKSKTSKKSKADKPRKNKYLENSKYGLKVEENERLEAPRTRKKVKTENDRSKVNFICRIKNLNGDGGVQGSKTMHSINMVKVLENDVKLEHHVKFEHQTENLLALSKSKQSTDHSSVSSGEYKSQFEALMAESLNKQKLLGQIAMSKALLSAPLLGMAPFNPAMMTPQIYNDMLMMNYLWRNPHFSAGMKQAP